MATAVRTFPPHGPRESCPAGCAGPWRLPPGERGEHLLARFEGVPGADAADLDSELQIGLQPDRLPGPVDEVVGDDRDRQPQLDSSGADYAAF